MPNNLNKVTDQTRAYSCIIDRNMNFVPVTGARSVDTGIYINFILILTGFPKLLSPKSLPGTTGHF